MRTQVLPVRVLLYFFETFIHEVNLNFSCNLLLHLLVFLSLDLLYLNLFWNMVTLLYFVWFFNFDIIKGLILRIVCNLTLIDPKLKCRNYQMIIKYHKFESLKYHFIGVPLYFHFCKLTFNKIANNIELPFDVFHFLFSHIVLCQLF